MSTPINIIRLNINKEKAFNKQCINITSYRINKITRHINHTIKKLPKNEILLNTTQVQLAISISTNNNVKYLIAKIIDSSCDYIPSVIHTCENKHQKVNLFKLQSCFYILHKRTCV